MNIFILDRDPYLAARMQCDKHVVKMTLETAQMLSTVRKDIGLSSPYRPTHKNHPCTKWIAQDYVHYMWAWEHFKALCNEYTLRYGKVHACERFLWEFNMWNLTEHKVEVKSMFNDLTHPLAMPDKYKTDCPVESYRNFYRGEKAHFAKWKLGNQPDWWNV